MNKHQEDLKKIILLYIILLLIIIILVNHMGRLWY